MRLYSIDIDETTGIGAMALVDAPAVEVDFLAFKKEEQPIALQFDDDRHIIRGVALRCDFPIYRYSESEGEYYIVFRRDAITKCIQKFFKDGLINSVNLMHDSNKFVDGVYLIESYQIDRENGVDPQQFSEMSDHSWIVGYKVENDEVWKAIKEKQLRGFSIEGMFYTFPDAEMTLDDLIDTLIN